MKTTYLWYEAPSDLHTIVEIVQMISLKCYISSNAKSSTFPTCARYIERALGCVNYVFYTSILYQSKYLQILCLFSKISKWLSKSP